MLMVFSISVTMSSNGTNIATPVKVEWCVFKIWLLHQVITTNTITPHYTDQMPAASRHKYLHIRLAKKCVPHPNNVEQEDRSLLKQQQTKLIKQLN
jgi:hypothetical protein